MVPDVAAPGGFAATTRTVETLPGDYSQLYANVRDAIWGVAPLAVRPEEACQTAEIIEAAIKSSQTRAAVSLPAL
jgi:predicted dehydrogenase